MDPIITPIAIILVKYALDKGLELGKEVGPKALETAKEMFGLALDRLRKNPKGEVIAGEFEKDPDTYQKPVEKALADEISADPDFAALLEGLLAQYNAAAEEYAASTSYKATVKGSGAIAQGEGAVAVGAGGVAVGGSVQGGINIGGQRKDEEESE